MTSRNLDALMPAANRHTGGAGSEATVLLLVTLVVVGCGTRSALDVNNSAMATRVAMPGGGACHDWTDLRYWQVYWPDRSVHGGAFDGRYVYFYNVNAVLRFDSQAAFDDPGAWSTADVSSLLQGWGEDYGLSGAIFDGRYMYFVPLGPTAVRYDTTADFGDSHAWETISLGQLSSPAYGGFGGGGLRRSVRVLLSCLPGERPRGPCLAAAATSREHEQHQRRFSAGGLFGGSGRAPPG